MPLRIELPRPLASYFAFAEAERGRDCRRFSITLSYLDRGRLDKLQWWWRIGLTEEAMLGESGFEARRQREIERFHRHIERWLDNNDRRMFGDGPFPCLGVAAAVEAPPAALPADRDTPGEAAAG